jgi:hypothetical protein
MSGAHQFTGDAAAPPSPGRAELLAVILYNFLCAPICVGMFGAPILYVCSFPATIGGIIFGDRLHFPGWESRIIAWCGELLDRHILWFVGYIGSLFLVPIAIGNLLRLFGLARMAREAEAKYGWTLFDGRSPGRVPLLIWTGILAAPFVPTVVAAMAACAIAALAMTLIALYGFVEIGRLGGFRYLITRWAVRDGMRDALKRRHR